MMNNCSSYTYYVAGTILAILPAGKIFTGMGKECRQAGKVSCWNKTSKLKSQESATKWKTVLLLHQVSTHCFSAASIQAIFEGWTVVPKRYVHVPSPGGYEWHLIYIKDLEAVTKLRALRWDHPGLSRWDLSALSVLMRDTQRRDIQGKEEKAIWWQKQRLKWCIHKPKNTWTHQKLLEAKQGSLLESGEGAWPCGHTLIIDPGLQNWESIHFYVLSHEVCDNLLQQPQEANKTIYCNLK